MTRELLQRCEFKRRNCQTSQILCWSKSTEGFLFPPSTCTAQTDYQEMAVFSQKKKKNHMSKSLGWAVKQWVILSFRYCYLATSKNGLTFCGHPLHCFMYLFIHTGVSLLQINQRFPWKKSKCCIAQPVQWAGCSWDKLSSSPSTAQLSCPWTIMQMYLKHLFHV